MVKIDSSIGSKSFASSDTRQFTVPDESRQLSPEDLLRAAEEEEAQQPFKTGHEAWEYRQQRVAEANQANAVHAQKNRSMIEILVGIGRAFKDVPVESEEGTVTYRVRTLKAKERLSIAHSTSGKTITSIEAALIIRTATLAHAVSHIDGHDLSYILNCSRHTEEDQVKYKESFIDELDENLAQLLFVEFENLTKENAKRFSPTDPKAGKELAEAFKKSGGRT